MVLSGAQGTVAQNVKELFVSKGSELELGISKLLTVEPMLPVAVGWQGAHPASIKGRVCWAMDALGFF